MRASPTYCSKRFHLPFRCFKKCRMWVCYSNWMHALTTDNTRNWHQKQSNDYIIYLSNFFPNFFCLNNIMPVKLVFWLIEFVSGVTSVQTRLSDLTNRNAFHIIGIFSLCFGLSFFFCIQNLPSDFAAKRAIPSKLAKSRYKFSLSSFSKQLIEFAVLMYATNALHIRFHYQTSGNLGVLLIVSHRGSCNRKIITDFSGNSVISLHLCNEMPIGSC